jgi:hypothetical protein
MPLPKYEVPIYEVEMISDKKKIEIRPFLVKEHKLLLIALVSENKKQISDSIYTILENCIKTKNINIDKMPCFDIEYLFLKIREKSLGELISVRVKCPETEKYFDVDLDLSKIVVVKSENNQSDIKISENLGIKMKYPTFKAIQVASLESDNIKKIFSIITNCIESVYDKENSYNVSDYSQKELEEFVEGLPQEAFEKINKFYESTPKIMYDGEVTSPYTKQLVKVRLDTFMDFFG